ncbi:hypothetical protein ACIGHG_03300 [Bacillus sp. NPDC077411]|uniref:Spore coat protein n=1 Tax=Bacillus bruguierae TaxID=3127667 RepID=A0ABU8FGA3_9BACI
MACTADNVCFDVCLVVTITPGGGTTSSVNCDGTCGTSPSIVINPDGSITITLPLVACFSITLNDDLSVVSSLTSLSF